jgi:hypothetical protein
MPLDALLTGALRDPSALRRVVRRADDDRWASYVIGVVHACLVRRGAERARAPAASGC